ncbi:MAG: tol-pal system protein YbgF [Pseudochelatococcus sp.]|jgi:tol-pal system protein YbgF|uniref:tol-pal system protein YbgF n=1 Tax=Pseudochelatococcus sp. TaxID=2020869 RepID=UPI003D9100CA
MTVRRLFFSRAGLALAALLLPVLMAVGGASSASAQDSTDFFLRLNRLENQVRELSGTVEKLEFENRRLQDQLRRFQEDVEFRFQEQAPTRQKRSDLDPQDGRSAARTATPASPASAPSPQVGSADANILTEAGEEEAVADDASDATAAPQVNAAVSSAPAATPPGAGRPLDLGAVAGIAAGRPAAVDEAADAPIPSVAATAPGDPRASYNEADAAMRRQEYEKAEMGFRQFLQSHPRDRLAADATFNLGESYFFRGRYREAAEQYLKLSTTYSGNARVPEGMLKLGMSLEALGARDQACATFSETIRKFPDADAELKAALGRARARANCA